MISHATGSQTFFFIWRPSVITWQEIKIFQEFKYFKFSHWLFSCLSSTILIAYSSNLTEQNKTPPQKNNNKNWFLNLKLMFKIVTKFYHIGKKQIFFFCNYWRRSCLTTEWGSIPINWIKDSVQSFWKVANYDRCLKKPRGYNNPNIVTITVMRTLVSKFIYWRSLIFLCEC